MQTFLPYPSFEQSAKCLDYKRLGKQRIEAWQIYDAIINKNGWRHHPAVKIWENNAGALLQYGKAMCEEWIKRGYKDNMLIRFQEETINFKDFTLPKIIGDAEYHNSHKSNLLRKNADFYSQYGWNVPNNLPYKWK